jgi:hypothetical protein
MTEIWFRPLNDDSNAQQKKTKPLNTTMISITHHKNPYKKIFRPNSFIQLFLRYTSERFCTTYYFVNRYLYVDCPLPIQSRITDNPPKSNCFARITRVQRSGRGLLRHVCSNPIKLLPRSRSSSLETIERVARAIKYIG